MLCRSSFTLREPSMPDKIAVTYSSPSKRATRSATADLDADIKRLERENDEMEKRLQVTKRGSYIAAGGVGTASSAAEGGSSVSPVAIVIAVAVLGAVACYIQPSLIPPPPPPPPPPTRFWGLF